MLESQNQHMREPQCLSMEVRAEGLLLRPVTIASILPLIVTENDRKGHELRTMMAILHWNELRKDEAAGTRTIVSHFKPIWCYLCNENPIKHLSDWQKRVLQPHPQEGRVQKRENACQECMEGSSEEAMPRGLKANKLYQWLLFRSEPLYPLLLTRPKKRPNWRSRNRRFP